MFEAEAKCLRPRPKFWAKAKILASRPLRPTTSASRTLTSLHLRWHWQLSVAKLFAFTGLASTVSRGIFRYITGCHNMRKKTANNSGLCNFNYSLHINIMQTLDLQALQTFSNVNCYLNFYTTQHSTSLTMKKHT